jgi:hypothetical protein
LISRRDTASARSSRTSSCRCSSSDKAPSRRRDSRNRSSGQGDSPHICPPASSSTATADVTRSIENSVRGGKPGICLLSRLDIEAATWPVAHPGTEAAPSTRCRNPFLCRGVSGPRSSSRRWVFPAGVTKSSLRPVLERCKSFVVTDWQCSGPRKPGKADAAGNPQELLGP